MPIQILPPLLANQIAAGEVVERPASVVKELLENSIDAGATRLEVDIEQGGKRLIRIRDNGCGVPKEELVLALSRHATSKLATIEDLEAIATLGFRGEALASISSVSRLTFTSRTAEQTEAWQAQAEGREMEVTIRPAAHPVGTTVEVWDLFFNTPARRKFLRGDKTEFTHIDELLRRIALARFDLHLILRHNGKEIRNYRPAKSEAEHQRRLAALCGNEFAQTAVAIRREQAGLTLQGWIAPPPFSNTELQYSYVNGRMMRDKLLNHAIRQAFSEHAHLEQPSYLLYLELPVGEVDVNVHPAKHEVRFHQARLVHDFVVVAIADALAQWRTTAPQQAEAAPVISETFSYPTLQPTVETTRHSESTPRHGYQSARESTGVAEFTPRHGYQPQRNEPSRAAIGGYQNLLQTAAPLVANPSATPAERTSVAGLHLLTLLQGQWLLCQREEQLGVINIVRIERQLLTNHLEAQWLGDGITTQPLLLPLSIPLDEPQWQLIDEQKDRLSHLGLHWKRKERQNQLILQRVPAIWRTIDLTQGLLALLDQLSKSDSELLRWMAHRAIATDKSYVQSEAEALLAQLGDALNASMQPIDLSKLLEEQDLD